METQKTIVNTSEGEITQAVKAIDPIWKIVGAAIGFVAVIFSVTKTWVKIEGNADAIKELKEQVTRQYNTHKTEIEALRKDSDEELDVLEEELDALKEKFLYHDGYEQATKELKK